jgi:hypothetical protein
VQVEANRSGGSQCGASSERLQELEYEIGDETRLFHVQKVADVVVKLELSARREERFDIAATALPSHWVILDTRQNAEEPHLKRSEMVK